MSKKTAVLSLTAALLVSLGAGLLVLELREEAGRAADALRERDALEDELRRARADLEKASAELAAASRREESLRERLEGLSRAVEERSDPPPAPAVEIEEAPAPFPGREPPRLGSLEEAEALAASLIERGDLEGLWLLAADLLTRGEEGYEKIIQLAALLDREQKNRDASGIFQLWNKEEILMGSFLRTIAGHSEETLRFLLHLDRKVSGGETVPRILRDLHGIIDDEAAAGLIGFYDGEDPEVLDGFTELYSRRLEGDLTKVRGLDDILATLGQIRTPRAAGLLLEALPRLPAGPLQKLAIQSLAWQRSPEAAPALRDLLAATSDAETARVIQAALRFLEGPR